MANFFDSTYDPRQLSGTSGTEITDLHPEHAYDVDLRRVEADERPAIASLNNEQTRVAKFMRAAKSAGKFRQAASIDEPAVRGKTPRRPASIAGTELPTRGDTGGRSGSIGYARKPVPQFGKPFV